MYGIWTGFGGHGAKLWVGRVYMDIGELAQAHLSNGDTNCDHQIGVRILDLYNTA